MQLSPRGRWGPSGPTVPVNIPASVAAAERARAASDAIRLVLGPWTADGKLPEHRRVPESPTVVAWREKLSQNGNGSTPPSVDWLRRLQRLASELPEDIDPATVLQLLDQIRAELDAKRMG